MGVSALHTQIPLVVSTMPTKEVNTPFPLIDADPHASRVIRYFRPSDYGAMAGGTAAFPALLYLMDYVDRTHVRGQRLLKAPLMIGGALGFIGGFLFAYQRSSFRFWGWTENAREQAMDVTELTERARQGKPLYGESDQPEWVKGAAFRNSAFSQLKFGAIPMFNLVNHKYHGTDPAKYSVSEQPREE